MTNNEIILAIVFITLILLLLVAGIVVSFHIAHRQRLEKNMKLQQAALDYEKELRAAEAAISESVMGHISRELHDNVGHIITQLRLQIEIKMLERQYEALLMPLQQTVVTASDQLRLLSRTLSPEFLQNNDLIACMRVEIERLKLLQLLRIHFSPAAAVPFTLNKEQQLLVFRIFQEAVSNAIKHAGAKNLFIELKDDEGFYMSVRDDGKGFVRKSEQENGIRNMIKRAELARLNIEIQSQPGEGSQVSLCTLPES